VDRCLVRAGVIDPVKRHRRKEMWKRWERGGPMELWQMDLVGGFLLADGSSAKALTGIDDHSRFCVSARLMARERTQFVSAMASWLRCERTACPAGPHRQRQGVHRKVLPASGGRALRPPLP